MSFSPFLRGARAGKKIRTFTEPITNGYASYLSQPTPITGSAFWSARAKAYNNTAVGSAYNGVFFDTTAGGNGAGYCTHTFSPVPASLTACQLEILPNNTFRPSGQTYNIRLLDADDAVLATLTLLFGDLAGATAYSGTFTSTLTTNVTAVGTDEAGIQCMTNAAAKTITGISKANPGAVDSTAHGYVNGDKVVLSGVVGMTEVNGKLYTVTKVNDNQYTIGVDTSAYTDYVSGGSSSKSDATTFRVLLAFDPVAGTVKAGYGRLSGTAGTDSLLARFFNIGASGAHSLTYTGTVAKLQIYQPYEAGKTNVIHCTAVYCAENPWIEFGDSIGNNRAQWMGNTSATAESMILPCPIPLGFDGRTTQLTASTNMLAQWEAQTLDWGFKRVIYSGGTNDFQTTGAAQQAAVIAADNAILAGLAAGGANVVVTTIPPRGLTAATGQERDAATILAVAAVNANRYTLAQRYGFAFCDLHGAMRVGPGSDLYRTGVSTDGVHPVAGAAGQNINAVVLLQHLRAG